MLLLKKNFFFLNCIAKYQFLPEYVCIFKPRLIHKLNCIDKYMSQYFERDYFLRQSIQLFYIYNSDCNKNWCYFQYTTEVKQSFLLCESERSKPVNNENRKSVFNAKKPLNCFKVSI